MEFTHTGWFAVFTGTETLMGRFREVEAWDPVTGTALVVDAERGARRPVTDYPDFSHLERADRIVAALPGEGWQACERGRGALDADSPVEPVVAWLVSAKGALVPVTMDADGEIGPDKTMNRFFPPGADPEGDSRVPAHDTRPAPPVLDTRTERVESGQGIVLSFALPEPPSWRRTWDVTAHGDPASLSRSDLSYDYFAVNVEFVVDEVEFISKLSFVTLVDLALAFRWGIDRLSRGEDASIGFTERAEVIRLRLAGETVTVSSSEKPARASVPRRDVVAAFSEFLRLAHRRLIAEVPELADNPVISAIVP